MKIATAHEMRRLDAWAVERTPLSIEGLMEGAAKAVLRVLDEEYGPLKGKSVVLLCGKGNNGGDGLALARLLKGKKARPIALLTSKPSALGKEAARQWAKAGKAKVPRWLWVDERARALDLLRKCDLVVDALFGTGLGRAVEGVERDAIEAVNALGKRVVAIDLPSGLSADDGRVMGKAIRAERTVTFALPKMAFFTPVGAAYCGRWSVEEIGFPPALLKDPSFSRETIEADAVRAALPVYGPATHKGTRGRVLIVAGSTGLTGAAALAAWGAQRIGAGLVTVACPKSLNPILEVKLTEPMTAPVPEAAGGFFSSKSVGPILSLMAKAGAMVLGPGIGRHPQTARMVRELLLRATVPMVVDADALFLCGGMREVFRSARAPILVTPHPGEAAQMLKTSISEVESHRAAVAEQIAREYNVTVVLKGPWTLVAHPQKGLRVNRTGTRALGTAGTGDVLSGALGGLLAQGMSPWEAAAAGVYLHGLAGRAAEERLGPDGLMAGDLLIELPRVLRSAREAKTPR
jgi:NAD(P)H-hydrate epimerase